MGLYRGAKNQIILFKLVLDNTCLFTEIRRNPIQLYYLGCLTYQSCRAGLLQSPPFPCLLSPLCPYIGTGIFLKKAARGKGIGKHKFNIEQNQERFTLNNRFSAFSIDFHNCFYLFTKYF